MHFRILKMIATSGFLTAVHQIRFRPDSAVGAYSAPPDSLAGLRLSARVAECQNFKRVS